MQKSVIGFLVVAAMLVVGAPRAIATTSDPHFDVIPFSGLGNSGTIAPGVHWSHSFTLFFINLTPALHVVWPAAPTHQDITDFHITFTELPHGVTIHSGAFAQDGNPPTHPWTDVISPDGHTITFTAPPGLSLNSGDNFSSLISLTHSVDSVHFSGAWSAVPEPSSLLLFGTGLLLLGLIVSRKQLRTSQTA